MWLIDREHCFVVTRRVQGRARQTGQTRATLTANRVSDYRKITFP